MDATTIDPVAIDTRIADLSTQADQAANTYRAATDMAHRLLGERKISRRRSRVWPTSGSEALVALAARIADRAIPSHDLGNANRALTRAAEAKAALVRLRGEITDLDNIHRQHRWSRFIEVADGHIHSATVCRGGTIRPTTRIGWHPELSGLTNADAVAKLGPLLCTHCFPTAPLEWTRGREKPVDPDTCTNETMTEAQEQAYNPRRMQNYVTCACTATVSVTATRKLRKHKRGDRKNK